MQSLQPEQWTHLVGAELFFSPQWLAPEVAATLMETLGRETPWREETIKLFGKEVQQPRLTAWYGDAGCAYTYSGLTLQPQPWTDTLSELRRAVEKAAGSPFNSVLLNLYRDGKDSMGWHSDDEPELGKHPVIASLSLGETRRFHLRHRGDRSVLPLRLDLPAGSLLIMAGETQHHWQHRLSKTQRPVGPRINLTFRYLA
jgi:alkylated DNA repair dioxygenase AlkB